MKRIIAIVMLAAASQAADVVLGRLSELSWTGTGVNKTAAWGTVDTLPDSYCWRHFKLNDNAASSSVEDAGDFNQPATFSDTTANRHTSGKINGAFIFNGAYIRVDGHAGFDASAAFTLTAWVRLDRYATFMRLCSIVGGWSWYWSYQGMTMYVGDGVGNVYSSQKVPIDSSWHFVAITYDSVGNYKMYFDEKQVSVSTNTMVNSAGDFVIGDDPTSSYPVKGAMDDVRIYTKALTSLEIAFIYNSGAGTELNLPTQ